MFQQPLEQHFVDPAAEADLAVDFYDGDALVEALAERRIGVDVEQNRFQTVGDQEGVRIVAEMAPSARVEHDSRRAVVER